jgi:fucose permease
MWDICSWINDSLGVRTSLMIGFTSSFCAIILLATAQHILMVYTVLFGLLPLGIAVA